MAPILREVERKAGVHLAFDYIGTLDGAEQIISGNDNHDLAWFSHSKYLDLIEQDARRHDVKASTRIMLSPVVLGVKSSAAARLGWTDRSQITWRQIAEAAKAGKLRFAMTNPASSNSGFTALLGVAAAFAGGADALDSGTLDVRGLRDLFVGQKLTAGSSGALADAYVADQEGLDGMINYESILLGLDEHHKLREPLTLIYPTEGIVTADYPLLLLNEAHRIEYDKLVRILESEKIQRKISEKTLRRPAVPGVPASPRLSTALRVELPFPSTAKTIDTILTRYLDEVRQPASATFVLDTSGSMADGDKINDLRQALRNLAGADTSLTGRYSRFHRRETLSFIPFDDKVDPTTTVTIGTGDTSAADDAILAVADRLDAEGGTSIYRALFAAYKAAATAQADEPDRYYSVVLMTDGLNNDNEPGYPEFERALATLPTAARRIPTFTVLFGDANPRELGRIATLTGGKVFDARDSTLTQVFKEIRGYQ
jgi:Ca-activated chloride channel family protein